MAMKILSNRWAFEFEEMIELPDKLDFGGIILWPEEELLVGNKFEMNHPLLPRRHELQHHLPIFL